ncbi:MAG: hypothetical protein WCK49_07040 [Myxococcaceae bacterium]
MSRLISFLFVLSLSIPALSLPDNSPLGSEGLTPNQRGMIGLACTIPLLGLSALGAYWTSREGSYNCDGVIVCCAHSSSTNCSKPVFYPSLCQNSKRDAYCVDSTSSALPQQINPVTEANALGIGIPLAIIAFLGAATATLYPLWQKEKPVSSKIAFLLTSAGAIAISVNTMLRDLIWTCPVRGSELQCCDNGNCFLMQPKEQCLGTVTCTQTSSFEIINPTQRPSDGALGIGIPIGFFGFCSVLTGFIGYFALVTGRQGPNGIWCCGSAE